MQRRLIAARLVAPLAAVTVALAGCSSAAPLSGSTNTGNTGGAASATGDLPPQSTPRTATDPDSITASLSGLTAECSAVLDAQSAIAALFAEPVDGHELDRAEVTKVFDAIGQGIPADLRGDIGTLHDAAERAVGRSAVAVAAILAETKVSGAMAAMSRYVKGCTPQTD